MSLRWKTLGVFGIVIALVVVIAAAATVLLSSTLSQIEGAENHGVRPAFYAADMKFHVIEVQQWLTDISATRAAPGFDDGFIEAAAHADHFRESMARLLEIRPDLSATLEELSTTFEAFYAQGLDMAKVYVDYGPTKGNEAMREFDGVAGAMAEGIGEINERLLVEAYAELDGAVATSSQTRLIVVVVAAFAMVASVAISLTFASRLAGRVKRSETIASHLSKGETHFAFEIDGASDEIAQMQESFQRVVEYLKDASEVAASLADGDLTAEFVPRSEDDTLGLALSRMSSGLRDLINGVDEVALQLAEGSQVLAAGSQETARTATETAGAVGQVADSADRQSRIAAKVSQALEDIVGQADQTSRAVNAVTESARGAGRAATAGMTQVHETQSAMEEIIASFDNVATVVGEVDQRAAKVDEIVDLIRSIAEQTNLLALNAAIEAARAGESGRGFAVVASEVKALAEESATSTEEIARIVEAMRDSVAGTVNAMEGGREHVQQGSSVVSAARETFEQIVNSIKRMQTDLEGAHVAAGHIEASAQSVGSEATSLVKMAESNSAVAQQLAAGAQEVAAASEEVGATAQDLEGSAAQLRHAMERFRLSGDQPAEDPAEDSIES